jgi:Ser/Thr protein kinase RdoA (MazF antagonist)
MGPEVPANVLSQFAVRSAVTFPLRHAAGFSGAYIWRVVARDGEWCLKAWPHVSSLESHLQQMHQWMRQARAESLGFIPLVRQTTRGTTFLTIDGWTWDLTEWMPGEPIADFEAPDWAIAAACRALGQLHAVWKRCAKDRGIPVAIQRRQKRLAQWDVASMVQGVTNPAVPEEQRTLLGEIATLLPRHPHYCLAEYKSITASEYDLQPCLGDLWREHVLFVDREVRGFIDFGAARMDTPAVDLARLLGSLACDTSRFEVGFHSYREMCPLSAMEEQLVYWLDAAGTLVAAMNWLAWLGGRNRTFSNPRAVTARLNWTLARLRRLRADGWF